MFKPYWGVYVLRPPKNIFVTITCPWFGAKVSQFFKWWIRSCCSGKTLKNDRSLGYVRLCQVMWCFSYLYLGWNQVAGWKEFEAGCLLYERVRDFSWSFFVTSVSEGQKETKKSLFIPQFDFSRDINSYYLSHFHSK